MVSGGDDGDETKQPKAMIWHEEGDEHFEDTWYVFPVKWVDGDIDVITLCGVDTGHWAPDIYAEPLAVCDTEQEAEQALKEWA